MGHCWEVIGKGFSGMADGGALRASLLHRAQCALDLRALWWTVDRSLRVPAAPQTTSVTHLDGSSEPAGDTLTVTGTPILLRIG